MSGKCSPSFIGSGRMLWWFCSWGIGWGFVFASTFPAWLSGFFLVLFFCAGCGVCGVYFCGGATSVFLLFFSLASVVLVVPLVCFSFCGWCWASLDDLRVYLYSLSISLYIYIYIYCPSKKIWVLFFSFSFIDKSKVSTKFCHFEIFKFI